MGATLSTQKILRLRGPKNEVSPTKPYAFLVEPERSASGEVVDVATIFLTNRECPYRCLMCDLWKNTLDESVRPGDIARQIRYALERLPKTESLKLYNSGNFFDVKAVPAGDREEIAELCSGFETVVVENHPNLCNERCTEFANMIEGRLEIAMGLETVHPDVLPRLNKQMTPDDFRRASGFLVDREISVRAFVLLKPPYMNEDDGIHWAMKSIEFAVDCGVSCVAVIPTRAGNGAIEMLQKRGDFSPPDLRSLELVMDRSLEQHKGCRVFADLWDANQFASCDRCVVDRMNRMETMNRTQVVQPPVQCKCDGLEAN